MRGRTFTGYRGTLKVTLNNGRVITTREYDNEGTRDLGTLIMSCLVGNLPGRDAFPKFINIGSTDPNSTQYWLKRNKSIVSPYIVVPTKQDPANLIGSAKFTALIRSIDVGEIPNVKEDGKIVLLDGQESSNVLARITASDIWELLQTIRKDSNYSATLEWTLELYNGKPEVTNGQ